MRNKYNVKDDLSLVIGESTEAAEDLEKKASISLRTIDNILAESTEASYDVLDRLYSYAYDTGYRFNIVKEEIYKENCKNKVLFHGASFEISEIKSDGSRGNCDFETGFYLGESYFQAASFVYDVNKSSIYAFELELRGLNVIELECDIDWMLLVCHFRKMITEYDNHPIITELIDKIQNADVIIAPIADNKMYNIMKQFGEGDITTKQAIHSLASSGLGNQYVLKTDKAISKLKEIERIFLSSSERNVIGRQMEDRGNEIDTKLKLVKRNFRGEGQYIDELFK